MASGLKKGTLKRFFLRNAILLFISLSILIAFKYLGYSSKLKEIISFISNRNIDEIKIWDEFELVYIKSSLDNVDQKAYFYKSSASVPTPLIISLHTWSGNYAEYDSIAILSKERNVNYIHPDFRGANSKFEACCSPEALSDIDDSISYALENANIDMDKIFVIGASGGGYATLCSFMKSEHRISEFSAWASISNLVTWYEESLSTNKNFSKDILNCTNSVNNSLNKINAENRSPIFWKTPKIKRVNSKLNIYTGVYDGINGSVSITHSIDFYNKILKDFGVKDSTKFVSNKEKHFLLDERKPLGNFGKIASRKIFLLKKFENIKLIIYEGNHEFLEKYALDELLNN